MGGCRRLFFYLFAFVAVASAFMVDFGSQPGAFGAVPDPDLLQRCGPVCILTGAEFLAMILLVVYVGAVAVLFLFVVMMLDVDFTELRAGAS